MPACAQVPPDPGTEEQCDADVSHPTAAGSRAHADSFVVLWRTPRSKASSATTMPTKVEPDPGGFAHEVGGDEEVRKVHVLVSTSGDGRHGRAHQAAGTRRQRDVAILIAQAPGAKVTPVRQTVRIAKRAC